MSNRCKACLGKCVTDATRKGYLRRSVTCLATLGIRENTRMTVTPVNALFTITEFHTRQF